MHADAVRLDKWLWAARFFKTRSLATDAVERGKVKQNGERTKPAHALKIGDTVDIDNGATVWEVRVTGLAEVRGSATIAATLYQETDKSLLKRQNEAEQRRFLTEPTAAFKGRPTKRDRRDLDKSGR